MIINIPPYYCDSSGCVPSYSVVWERCGEAPVQLKGKELKKIISAQKVIWERFYGKKGSKVVYRGQGGSGGGSGVTGTGGSSGSVYYSGVGGLNDGGDYYPKKGLQSGANKIIK